MVLTYHLAGRMGGGAVGVPMETDAVGSGKGIIQEPQYKFKYVNSIHL